MSFDDIIRVGNIGTVIVCTITKIVNGVETAVNVSGTTLVQIEIQKPDGERLAPITASFLTTGIDGKIWYTDNTGIFTVGGRWKVRGIATTGTVVFKGSWYGFSVDE